MEFRLCFWYQKLHKSFDYFFGTKKKKKKHGGFNHSFSDMAGSCRTPAGGGREKKEGTEMLWGCP